MLTILNQNNFSVDSLKLLYQAVVIEPFNKNHNAIDYQNEIAKFFSNNIKPLFKEIVSFYQGESFLIKSLTIIKEVRWEILNRILISLYDNSITDELFNIDINIKSKLENLITNNINELEEVAFNCPVCVRFRELLSELLEASTVDSNQLNTNNVLLDSWLALDPQNNIKRGYYGYVKNIFSYNEDGVLILCNSQDSEDSYGRTIIEAIAIYYLATKFASDGLVLSQEEQNHRFTILISTLTECLRAYHGGEYKRIDFPSCAPVILCGLVTQCSYEDSMQFISRKIVINRVVNELVLKRINELLATIRITEEIVDLMVSLVPAFGDEERLNKIALTSKLKDQRYGLFDNENNNELFFNLIKQKLAQIQKEHINDNVFSSIYEELIRYDYKSFVDKFQADISETQIEECFSRFVLSKEIKLIGYALSDPAYNCYPQLVNMCIAKLQKVNVELSNSSIISDIMSQKIAESIINEISIGIFPQSLFISGFNKIELSILIKSYKKGCNSCETDMEFLARISAKHYTDIDELGQTEQIYGLDSIINQTLVNRSSLLEEIARLILVKINQEVLFGCLLENSLVDSSPSIITDNSLPFGYLVTNEIIVDEIVSQKLRKIIITPMSDSDVGRKFRWISKGIRDDRYVGPYSNLIDLPDVPIIHPYYINGILNDNESYERGIVSFPVVVALPRGRLNNLPSGVKEQLIKFNININNLEVFFCIQNMPWSPRESLLFRPHHWIYKDAPLAGQYNKKANILAAVMSINANLSELIEFDIGINSYNNKIVYKLDNMKIRGIDNFNSHALYSFCFVKNNNCAALTLHWLLNKMDYYNFMEFLDNRNDNALSLKDIIFWGNSLINSQLNKVVPLCSGSETEFTAIDALQALIIGGQPEVFINQNNYNLIGQKGNNNYCWRREIFGFSSIARTLSSLQTINPVVDPDKIAINTINYSNPVVSSELPLEQQPIAYRIREANNRLR